MTLDHILMLFAALAAVAIFVRGFRSARRPAAPPAPRPAPTATYYGDSATHGGYLQDGVSYRYDPDPVTLINRAGPVQGLNRAYNGLQLRELLAGGAIEYAAPELGGEGGLSIPAFVEQLASDPSDIVVLACHHVDAMFAGRVLEDYLGDVRTAVGAITAVGKTPVLRGLNRFVLSQTVTQAMLDRRDVFDAALRAEAPALGVSYIDIAAAGEPEITPTDGLHPTMAYHQRIAAVIAARLAEVAP